VCLPPEYIQLSPFIRPERNRVFPSNPKPLTLGMVTSHHRKTQTVQPASMWRILRVVTFLLVNAFQSFPETEVSLTRRPIEFRPDPLFWCPRIGCNRLADPNLQEAMFKFHCSIFKTAYPAIPIAPDPNSKSPLSKRPIPHSDAHPNALDIIFSLIFPSILLISFFLATDRSSTRKK